MALDQIDEAGGELELKGLGLDIWLAGNVMGLAGLLVGGAPWDVLDSGTKMVDAAVKHALGPWATAAIERRAASSSTSAPILEKRPTLRARRSSRSNRPLWLTPAPCLLLLALALLPPSSIKPIIARRSP